MQEDQSESFSAFWQRKIQMSQIIFEGPVNMISFKHDPAGIEVR